MSDDDHASIELRVDSPEARAATAEALTLVASVRGVIAAEDYAIEAAEIRRVVSAILGESDDPLEVVAQRLACALHGLTMVAVFATEVVADISGNDPLDIDAMIQRRIDSLE